MKVYILIVTEALLKSYTNKDTIKMISLIKMEYCKRSRRKIDEANVKW